MITLSRKENESIICTLPNGDEVEMLVTQIDGNQARISIDAPDEVFILREELRPLINLLKA